MSVGYGVTTAMSVGFVCRIDWDEASEVAMESEAKQQAAGDFGRLRLDCGYSLSDFSAVRKIRYFLLTCSCV